MTSTALARIESGMQPRDLGEAREFAKLVSGSALLPQALRNKPEDVFVIVVSGHELGLSPMQAIRSISVIQGKPVLDAALMVALVKRRSEVCEYFTLVESSPKLATYETKRAGEPTPTRMTFTIEEAKAAGLAAKDNWQKHTAAMLRARASSALARAVYPDLVLGVYEPDEAEEFAPISNVRQFASKAEERRYIAMTTRPAPVHEDAISNGEPEAPVTVLEAQLEASIAQAKAKAPLDPGFEAMNERLHALPGYAGDAGKEARRAWWAGVLGYRNPTPKWNPYRAYVQADPEVKRNVEAAVAKLEEAAAGSDDVPAFERTVGEDDDK